MKEARECGTASNTYTTHATRDGIKTLCGRPARAVTDRPYKRGVGTCKRCDAAIQRGTTGAETCGTGDDAAGS